ncbi:MAG TPA: hypothetical protein VGI79_01015 [Caulobacteraceae bacterium]|jgi:hypothetical protein
MRKKPSESKHGGESTTLGARGFAAINAVEGITLTPAGRERVKASAPIEQRRAEVLRAYGLKRMLSDMAAWGVWDVEADGEPIEPRQIP